MTYREWIERFSSLTDQTRAELRATVLSLDHRPTISVILPVYNPDLCLLSQAIDSVRHQLYQEWELCIADDASTDNRIGPLLRAIAREDRRIKILFRERNGHISACSNSALSLARGEWCALLDQDDELAENALAEVALASLSNPGVRLIYSDEDFLDADGVRSNPFFKSDWNPQLFLAQNYLNHLGVYQTSLVHEIGGFREGFEGSQDYDLALRCVARLQPQQICHIPQILYHWRMAKGSLAERPDAKPYARHAARKAINSYLADLGIAAEAKACPENDESHRVMYELPSPPPAVTIIVATEKQETFVPATDYPVLEVVRTAPGAETANACADTAQGEILLFLSGDISAAEPGWLTELVSHAVRPDTGAVGGRLWSAQGTLADGGLILGLGGIAAPAFGGLPRGHPGYFNRAWLQQNLSAVAAACLCVRRNVFQATGGFDATNLPHSYYNIDFCLRVREKGLQVIWTPYASLTLSSVSDHKSAPSAAEISYLQKHWKRELSFDPFYNPNLSLDLPGFILAIPPRPDSSRS